MWRQRTSPLVLRGSILQIMVGAVHLVELGLRRATTLDVGSTLDEAT